MANQGASGRQAISKVIEINAGMRLCEQSYPVAHGQHAVTNVLASHAQYIAAPLCAVQQDRKRESRRGADWILLNNPHAFHHPLASHHKPAMLIKP